MSAPGVGSGDLLAGSTGDTPRTDAEASDGWSGDAICVGADFARELERENDRLRRALSVARQHIASEFGFQNWRIEQVDQLANKQI